MKVTQVSLEARYLTEALAIDAYRKGTRTPIEIALTAYTMIIPRPVLLTCGRDGGDWGSTAIRAVTRSVAGVEVSSSGLSSHRRRIRW